MTLPHAATEALKRGDWDAYDRALGIRSHSDREARRHTQSRMDSFMEALTNTAIGFTISLVTWVVVSWAMAIPMTWTENIMVTGIFTVVSIARQYVLRRIFDGRSPWAALKARFQ